MPSHVGHDPISVPVSSSTISRGPGLGGAVALERRQSVETEFTAFVAANHARLLHIADLITGDCGRAEDLLQTVLTRTYLRWSKVRQDSPLGYVRAGLANARTDWWRRGWHRERPIEALPDTHAAPDHSGQVVGRDAVQRALALLTQRERAVIVLRFYEDLSEVEIAGTLRIAPGTVKSTCSRALTKLRVSPELNDATDANAGRLDRPSHTWKG
jgi:RNA polymerase sigma-70 factor (sigma-E family)